MFPFFSFLFFSFLLILTLSLSLTSSTSCHHSLHLLVDDCAKMPIAVASEQPKNGLTKFTNCRLLRGDKLVNADLWVSSETGKIVDSQACFFDQLVLPEETIDLGGRIISPGMIECQLNGAFGFNFSTLLDDMSQYGKQLKEVNKLMVQTGVTSYVPTITSQRPELYQAVRSYLLLLTWTVQC